MKTIIFSANNDRGEPLIEVAARQGEIWTARRKTNLKEGDTVRLLRKRGGKHEYEGRIVTVTRTSSWKKFGKAGFETWSSWRECYCKLNHLEWYLEVYPFFIHIINIKPHNSGKSRKGAK